MAGKREKAEDIVLKLRQVEVLQASHDTGSHVPHASEAVRQIGVTQQTFYRWHRQYGGMNRDQLKRLKELEKENGRLRRAGVSDLTLDKMILTEAARGNLSPSRRRRWPSTTQTLGILQAHSGVIDRRSGRLSPWSQL